jgi:hypothetical protein
MARLAVLRAAGGARGGREAWVREEGVLGRKQGDSSHTLTVWTEQEEVALDVFDALVSRRHARLYFEGERLLLQDLGSENGAFLDGRPLPSAGRGRPGAPVPVTGARAQVGLGPRCLVEVALVEAPLGLPARDWGRVSASLSYPNLKVLCDTAGWGERLQATPSDPALLAQFREWYNSNHQLFDQMVEVLRGEMGQQRQDYRLALEQFAAANVKTLDTILEVVRALAGRSPAP